MRGRRAERKKERIFDTSYLLLDTRMYYARFDGREESIWYNINSPGQWYAIWEIKLKRERHRQRGWPMMMNCKYRNGTWERKRERERERERAYLIDHTCSWQLHAICKVQWSLRTHAHSIFDGSYLLLDNGMQSSMNIFGHTLGITTNIKISPLRDYIPYVWCLHMEKIQPWIMYLSLNCKVFLLPAFTHSIHHLMLHILLLWPLSWKCQNQLRQNTLFNKIIEFILINEIL